MHIVADENIPFVETLFAAFGKITLLPGRHIQASDVAHADILLVRSVTKVNAALLDGSNVKFVGTCTIGIDHLDTLYLQQKGITYSSAPGCNAKGVVQFAMSTLATLGLLDHGVNTDKKVAVIGCGNVGGTVLNMLHTLGFDCVGIDPLISAEKIAPVKRVPLGDLSDYDMVFCHTPYTTTGNAPTHHLINAHNLSTLKPDALLVNAGRGGVIDNQALLAFLANKDASFAKENTLNVVLDVWEPEPDMSPQLLDKVTLGSPHIAGYSYEGRVNGSLMIHDALLAFLTRQGVSVQSQRAEVDAILDQDKPTITVKHLRDAILQAYDVRTDDADLRNAVQGLPASFDALRKNYPKRREFSHFNVLIDSSVNDADKATLLTQLTALGFGIK